MIKQLIPVEPQICPVQMPVSYFGAIYPDSQCIEWANSKEAKANLEDS